MGEFALATDGGISSGHRGFTGLRINKMEISPRREMMKFFSFGDQKFSAHYFFKLFFCNNFEFRQRVKFHLQKVFNDKLDVVDKFIE
jgi:hypothetical protein